MKLISYFSYKGGAGRSTLAYNTIPLMVNDIKPTKEAPVIVIDMDIDSCGMSYLLEVPNKKIKEDACVQYILENGCAAERTQSITDNETFKKLIPVGKKFGYDIDEAVLFLPAKDMKNVNGSRSSNYDDSNCTPFLNGLMSFVETCETYNVPAIIFDSAVGNQASAIVSNRLANIIICCLRPTNQFVDGTVRYLESLDSDDGSPLGGGRKKIVLVPNVVPQGEMIIDNKRYPDAAVTKIISMFSKLLDGRDEDDDIVYNSEMMNETEFGIPALTRFMWREGQLYTQAELQDDEIVVMERYKKLAAIVNKL